MAVADLPPRFLPTCQDIRPYYALEGDSSRRLVDQFGVKMFQWQNRPSVVAETGRDEETLEHLLFHKAGTIRVRFRMAGPMQPRVIDVAGPDAE